MTKAKKTKSPVRKGIAPRSLKASAVYSKDVAGVNLNTPVFVRGSMVKAGPASPYFRNVQILQDERGNPTHAVVPWSEWEKLTDEDSIDADLARAALASDEESFPNDVVKRLLDGDNPIKVYREYRGLTQAGLCERAGIRNAQYLSQLETGRASGGIKTRRALAKVLGVDIDDLE